MTSPEKIQALLRERARQEAWDAGVPTCRLQDGEIVWDYPDGKTYNHIPLLMCDDRGLYRIYSRNLSFGVFSKASRGFVGIREKFGDLYLFTEYHWDIGPPFGTVHPKEKLEMLPEEISIKETLGTVGSKTGRPLEHNKDWRYKDDDTPLNEDYDWDKELGPCGKESRRPILNKQGWGWRYKDTKEAMVFGWKDDEPGESALSVSNEELFKWLEAKRKQY